MSENSNDLTDGALAGITFPAENLRPCNLTLPVAQQQFVSIMSQLQIQEKNVFLKWIKWNWMNDNADDNVDTDADECLKSIAATLRGHLPPSATLPSESILGMGGGGGGERSLHVDSFLYDDEEVDKLGDEGILDRNYCVQCGSHKTRPLDFISHSLSREQLCYVFTALLPPLREDQIVLDIGSRLGAVLYGAYLYSKAGKILGIEMNPDFCVLQQEIVKKYGFQDRVEVVEGDILHRSDILLVANVIIMNNVFECFMTPEQQVNMWKYLRQTIKKGTLLVTNPPIENVFSIQETGIVLTDWLQEVPMYNKDPAGITDNSQVSDLKLYEVL